MPTSFLWLAADREGHVARFDAERWGEIPDGAHLLSDSERDPIWETLYTAWREQVAPRAVFEHNDLTMVPESDAPHLIAFARAAPALPGGQRIGERVLAFERPTAELHALRVAQEDADERGEAIDEAAMIVGSLAIDRDSFGTACWSAFYAFSRSGEDRCYWRSEEAPKFPLSRRGWPGLLVLEIDFATIASVDVRDLVGAARCYGVGHPR